jgi:putative Holliday junction resolvase
VLALDVGEKRIGVALSDETELLASPHGVIQRQSTAAALEAVARAIGETGAGLVVVGLPISFDGQLHAQAHAIQAFAERLRRRIAVPLVYADETLSSVRAEEQLRAAGVRPERIRERLDAAAAAVILQEYLDQRSQASSAPAPTANEGAREGQAETHAAGAAEADRAKGDAESEGPETSGGMEKTRPS